MTCRRINHAFTHASRNLTLIAWLKQLTQRCHGQDNQVCWLRLCVTSLQWVKWKEYRRDETMKSMHRPYSLCRKPWTFFLLAVRSVNYRFRIVGSCTSPWNPNPPPALTYTVIYYGVSITLSKILRAVVDLEKWIYMHDSDISWKIPWNHQKLHAQAAILCCGAGVREVRGSKPGVATTLLLTLFRVR